MGRLVFANQLRGLAAFAVLANHLVGVFWSQPGLVGTLTASPVQPGPVPAIFNLFARAWLDFGALAVAVFFLISGLVIPISLTTHTRWTFLLARGLRIYPTYVFGLLLGAIAVWLNAHYWHLPMPFSRSELGINGLLVYDITGDRSVDQVNWTLIVELKFYFLMMLAAPLIRRGDLRVLFAIALAALAYNFAWHKGWFGALAGRFPAQFGMASVESLCLVFMLIGVLFSYHVRGQLSGRAALLAGSVMSGLFIACWVASAREGRFAMVPIHCGYALAIFGAAYLLRDHFRPFWALDALAAISFPLYVIHFLLGCSLLKLFMLVWGIGYLPALVLTFALVVLAATALHLTVERWSIGSGQRLKLAARRPPAAPHIILPRAANGPSDLRELIDRPGSRSSIAAE